MQSALGNWVLDLSGGSTANGTAIHLYTPNGTVAQLFTLSSSEVNIPTDAPATIRSTKNTGLVFDVPGASTANSTQIQLYTSNGSNAQKYRFTSVGNATYRITNVNSGKALDVYGARRPMVQRFNNMTATVPAPNNGPYVTTVAAR